MDNSILKNTTQIANINYLAVTESEQIWASIWEDDQDPYPFYLMWLIGMVERLEKVGDENGVAIMLSTLYESLKMEIPSILPQLVREHRVVDFARELMLDLLDLADIGYDTTT